MWKKIILVGAVVLSGLSLRAQTIDFTGITIRTERVVCERRNFAMFTGSANFDWSDFDGIVPSFGARIGAYRRVGLYAGVEVGIGGLPFHDYEEIDIYSGRAILVKRKDPRLDLAFGGLLRVSKASTLYLGGGWTFGQRLFQGQNGTWYMLDESISSPVIEAGALFHIKEFTLMIGGAFADEWIDDCCYGKISFGVGYNF